MGFFSNLINNIVKTNNNSKCLYDESTYEINLNLIDEKNIKIKLANPIYIESHDISTNKAYTLRDSSDDYGNLFVEHIDLFNNCDFIGGARSVYQDYLKEKLQLDSLQVHKKFLINESEFIVFIVNDEYFLSFVHVYDYNKHTFLIDFSGKLFTKLVQVYKPDFNMNEELYKRVDLSIDINLVNDNHIYNCFTQNCSDG